MQSSLGIYIEENIIKYAKLQKDKESIKVESYNVAFYENNLEETIKKIINETYSYKVPISINVDNEIYHSFQISSLLSSADMKKAVNLEYDFLCNERGYNKISLDHKYMIVEQKENTDKKKTISVIANKNEISKRVMALGGNKVASISPISVSVKNLIADNLRENYAIVNIEDQTQVTIVVEGEIYQIEVIPEGMKKILDDINKTENSYLKSYDVCKNMTVYTQNSTELYSSTDEYMDVVVSTMYKIAMETKNIITKIFSNIDKIYITGLGTCINNVDLLFQENIPTAKCEILKPYFLNNVSIQMPIKEYIEVNSAIALALDGLGFGNKEVNFAKAVKTTKSNVKAGDILNAQVDLNTIKVLFENLGKKLKDDFTAPLESIEKLMMRGGVACIIIAAIFAVFSNAISSQLEDKTAQVSSELDKAKAQTDKIDSDIRMISSRTTAYQQLINEITNPVVEETPTVEEKQRVIAKDAIPNMLNRVMFVIPKKVKLVSIKNTTSNHIVINAEAEKYEQLGYFKAVLTTNGILKNVKSTNADKTGAAVQVTIEGDLP